MLTIEIDGLPITIDDDGAVLLNDDGIEAARRMAVARILSNHQDEFEAEFKMRCHAMLEYQTKVFQQFKDSHERTR